jgi:hypothetical protein
LLNLRVQKPWAVKAFFVLTVAGVIAGMAMMIFSDIQIPGVMSKNAAIGHFTPSFV